MFGKHKKASPDFVQFAVIEVDQILYELGDIIGNPDIQGVDVNENTDIRAFLHGYSDVARDEIIRSLGDRLDIVLEPTEPTNMKAIALKMRE